MNLGLGNLKELKAWLLAEELRTETAWDVQIAAIGRGVAANFERHCNRKFERVALAQVDFAADRGHYVVPRFPIETLTAVEFREDMSGSWQDISGFLESWSVESGLVTFSTAPGSRANRVRLTWTGGYWFDSSEDGSEVLPVGATKVPDDLKLAWLQHCQAVWAKYPKLGTPVNTVAAPAGLATMVYSAEVEATLQDYRRLQLT